MEIETKSINP